MIPLRALRRALGILAPAACAAALVAYAAPTAAVGGDAAGERRTIASTVAGGLRVQLEAVRASGGDVPEAMVRVSASERRGGAWRRLGDPQPVVPAPDTDRFFWHVVTGAGALKGFSVTTSTPRRVELAVLITPSIGFSDLNRYVVRAGRLVRA